MNPFKEAPMFKRLRHRLARKTDDLVLESCPLHTERADWAAQAPAQAAAACQRGADVIAFTEVHTHLARLLTDVCAKHGYKFFHGTGDCAIAYKATLHVIEVNEVQVPGAKPYALVTFDFHGSLVAVFALHWETHGQAARSAQTSALATEMRVASAGSRLSFYLADSNPTKPLSDPTGEPRASLELAGLPLVWTELNSFPPGVGVTTIGRNMRDHRVSAKSAVLSPALGSDHKPGTATYAVKRARR